MDDVTNQSVEGAIGPLDPDEIQDAKRLIKQSYENIKAIAEKHGAPEKYNATITFAFMSIVAERKAKCEHATFVDFLSNNKDLLERSLLESWYSQHRLTSAIAKQQFLLPDVTN